MRSLQPFQRRPIALGVEHQIPNVPPALVDKGLRSLTIAEMVKRMLAAGASPEIVEIAVSALEESVIRHAPSRIRRDAQQKAAIRSKRYRDKKNVTQRDASVTSVTASLPASPSSSPPTPPLITTSSPNPASLRSAPAPRADEDKTILFAEGQVILLSFGIPKERSGALIGGWLKRSDAATVLKAIEQARDFAVSNPTAYIATILSKRQSNGKQSLSELAHDLADEVREREREEDTRRTGTDERSGRDR